MSHTLPVLATERYGGIALLHAAVVTAAGHEGCRTAVTAYTPLMIGLDTPVYTCLEDISQPQILQAGISERTMLTLLIPLPPYEAPILVNIVIAGCQSYSRRLLLLLAGLAE